jgi:hypothetical protein
MKRVLCLFRDLFLGALYGTVFGSLIYILTLPIQLITTQRHHQHPGYVESYSFHASLIMIPLFMVLKVWEGQRTLSKRRRDLDGKS